YFLIYGARSEWDYQQIAFWSRYQVFSHLGLVLFVSGGLPRWRDWFLAGPGRWTPAANRAWLAALVALLLTQAPRAVVYPLYVYDRRQGEQLRAADAVDARCRDYHISAADARAALEPLPLAGGGRRDNAWDLLRGSDDPRPLDPARVRRLLRP